jgi:hypothetical protein
MLSISQDYTKFFVRNLSDTEIKMVLSQNFVLLNLGYL